MNILEGREFCFSVKQPDGSFIRIPTYTWEEQMAKKIEELEQELGVTFRKKSEVLLMRMVAWFLNLFPNICRLSEVEVGSDHHLHDVDPPAPVYRVIEERRGDRFMGYYATTCRLPFQKIPWIAHPDDWDVTDTQYEDLWAHEKHHADDERTGWGLFKMFWLVWLLPLPVVLSGRWYIERWAFLEDIRKGRITLEEGADRLWNDYLLAWPRPWAIQWWKDQLERGRNF